MAPDQCLNVPPRLTQATWHRPPRACKFSKVLKLTPLNAWAFAWAWYASPCPSPGGHPGKQEWCRHHTFAVNFETWNTTWNRGIIGAPVAPGEAQQGESHVRMQAPRHLSSRCSGGCGQMRDAWHAGSMSGVWRDAFVGRRARPDAGA